MEKQKRWQLLLILTVIAITIYNVLPTLIFYGQALHKPVDEKAAQVIAEEMSERINHLEGESLDWLAAFCKNLSIQPLSIHLENSNASQIKLSFKSESEAELFKKFLPAAGEMIPFAPSQLSLGSFLDGDSPKQVVVQRKIGTHLDPKDVQEMFTFGWKREASGKETSFYRDLVMDRVRQLSRAFLAFENRPSRQVAALLRGALSSQDTEDLLWQVALEIEEYQKLLTVESPIAKRYFAGLFEQAPEGLRDPVRAFTGLLEKAEEKLVAEQTQAVDMQGSQKQARLALFQSVRKSLQEHASLFQSAAGPFDWANLEKSTVRDAEGRLDRLDFQGRHPFIKAVVTDWDNDKLSLEIHPELESLLEKNGLSEADRYVQERLSQMLVNDIAQASRFADEVIKPEGSAYVVELSQLTNSQSFLAFNLGKLAQKYTSGVQDKIQRLWQPQHPDLKASEFPLLDYSSYESLPLDQRRLALLVFAPASRDLSGSSSEEALKSLQENQLYVIAKGLNRILQKYRMYPDSEEASQFLEDFEQLQKLLQGEGFVGYPGSFRGEDSPFKEDFIFELNAYYANLLKASRENFSLHGSKRYAVLEFTDREQRLLTKNKIETQMHEDLMKWRDEYRASQVDLQLTKKYLVPPPAKSVLWNNFKLSVKKYFRGDDNKVLKWGLDLSGGKMVRIGLRDQNHRPVTDEASLKQGVNELTQRVNKMGLSEVNVRIEGNNLALDFPGSQGFSASELVKASSMYFHVVNEKFSLHNKGLAPAVHQFLQDVWNEALVTNRQDVESLSEIAWRHLGLKDDGSFFPKSDHARVLFENGLRLPNPKTAFKSNAFDDTLSSVALLRGDQPSEWGGQSHPLLLVFHNYALEGADLENIQGAYDPEKGNIISFGVKSAYSKAEQAFDSPRDGFSAWTSQFSHEKIAGTQNEEYSQGHGWRMAVILNGYVISAPTLNQPLRHHAMIYGKFSQREVNRLVSDLKAGSLTFTPKVLSEENISPDLGKEERFRGIASAVAALVLVVFVMVVYYHFGGLIASVAVFCNLLIMWGVLQNLDAALTLAGIAGIILTVGMAVDANVLIFERIREEFEQSGRISSAVQAGYKKAFSAIIDSNVTTLIAALILMQFDSGPIKGFAITLIIGIASSMFTALFMTRYFFAGWVQNPKNTRLSMLNLIGKPNFDFLAKAKPAIILSVVLALCGSFLFVAQSRTLLGMDFTGGYALAFNLEEEAEETAQGASYRTRVTQALLDAGAEEEEFQVRELNKSHQIRVQLAMSLEEEGHAFHGMPDEKDLAAYTFAYEKNPRIVWVLEALNRANLQVESLQLKDLDKNWTSISGQFSSVMLRNALMGLAAATVSILLYITLRFEFKYAVSSIVGIVHDVLISLSCVAILHKLGVPLQMNMETIAAVMTIIGYSLNDTIIVFDRIREDVHLMKKKSFQEIVNHALNATLSRTLLTSGTTLLVLLPLVIFGGSMIFDFAMVMAIGVVVGTTSSWFIAAPVMHYFHEKNISLPSSRNV